MQPGICRAHAQSVPRPPSLQEMDKFAAAFEWMIEKQKALQATVGDLEGQLAARQRALEAALQDAQPSSGCCLHPPATSFTPSLMAHALAHVSTMRTLYWQPQTGAPVVGAQGFPPPPYMGEGIPPMSL